MVVLVVVPAAAAVLDLAEVLSWPFHWPFQLLPWEKQNYQKGYLG
jgi:hypothetical protein